MIWCLSFVEIVQNGLFFVFFGLWCVYIIIVGKGLCLYSLEVKLEVKFLTLLEFDGGLVLEVQLIDGLCCVVNVICDFWYVQVKVQVYQGDFVGQVGDLVFVIDGVFYFGGDYFVVV